MDGRCGSLGSDSAGHSVDQPLYVFTSTKPEPCIWPYNWPMRILMFTGMDGVGKTSLAAATGVKLAALNYRTL